MRELRETTCSDLHLGLKSVCTMKPLGNLVNTTAAGNVRNEYSVKRLVSIETKGPLTSLIMDGIGRLVLVFGRAAKRQR